MEGPVESEAAVMGSDQFRLMLYVMPVLLIAWMVSCLGVNIWLMFALVICYSFWVSVVSLHPLREPNSGICIVWTKVSKGRVLATAFCSLRKEIRLFVNVKGLSKSGSLFTSCCELLFWVCCGR